ncbi:hypothetical protein QUF70_19725 [Desulfobacterales bacterium HSG17]|nr:hypothetical protein [Desulfobacterales bacterium HSG17]
MSETLKRRWGGDGKPVFCSPVNTVRHYFWDNENRSWPSDTDVVRFGCFFHLELCETLALVLKNQWEQFFSKAID